MTHSPSISGLPQPLAEPSKSLSTMPTVIVTLAAILFLPGGVFFLGETTSMSPGVTLAAIAILGMRMIGAPGTQPLGRSGTDMTITMLVVVLLTVHLIIRALVVEVDVIKAAGSLVIAALVIMACGTASAVFRQASDVMVRRAILIAVAIFLLAALFSLLGIQPESETATSKPIFPFTEPSLFAGAFLPVIAFLSVTSKGWRRWIWILTSFALGYLLENLSLVVGSLVVTVACLPVSRLIAFGAAITLVLPFLDLSYFMDRMQFDVRTSDNLSSLVYIQGWEMIGAATSETLGWGLGFQQLGYTFLNAPTSDLIYRLTGGTDLNLKEGSFAAAKLISELGVFGGILIACHGFLATRAFILLRRVAIKGEECPLGHILALCSVYTFIVDMYVRGAGYFSSPTMLMITSLFLLYRVPKDGTPLQSAVK